MHVLAAAQAAKKSSDGTMTPKETLAAAQAAKKFGWLFFVRRSALAAAQAVVKFYNKTHLCDCCVVENSQASWLKRSYRGDGHGVIANSLRLIRSHNECEVSRVQWVSHNVGLGGEVVGKKVPSYKGLALQGFCA